LLCIPRRLKENNCILWLFQDANVNTAGKYAAAVIGTMLMAFCLEILRASRGRMAKGQPPFQFMAGPKTSPLMVDLILAGSYVVQMTLAYWLMLLVMLYEAMVFIAIVVGLGAGYFTVLRANRRLAEKKSADKDVIEEAGSVEKAPVIDDKESGGTESPVGSVHDDTIDTNSPCCNTAEFAA
jgi:multisubunit Na+/H+ antiporter MnhC subunit